MDGGNGDGWHGQAERCMIDRGCNMIDWCISYQGLHDTSLDKVARNSNNRCLMSKPLRSSDFDQSVEGFTPRSLDSFQNISR